MLPEMREKDQARFWSKVAPPNEQGCMLWLAGKDRGGYGQFRLDGKSLTAHSVSWKLAYGPVSDGLVIDHLCRVRHCVAPEHFEAVTYAENSRRGQTGINNRAKTHCPQGHPYDDENTYAPLQNRRKCRACHRAQNRASYHRRRAVL